MSGLPVTIRRLADSTLLVEVGAEPLISASRAAAVNRLAQRLIELTLPGVTDIVPSYTTIMIEFDLLETDVEALEAAIAREAAAIAEAGAEPLRRITIPVLYGGEHGPDLEEAAQRLGFTPEEVIARHSGADYFVAAVGFSPGFGFLLGLPKELTIPRRATPRVKVPAGSVATAGGQSGVYPMSTPGGWWLLGKTPARLFDLRHDPPFALAPGDGVRFQPIDRSTFDEMEQAAEAGELVLTMKNPHPLTPSPVATGEGEPPRLPSPAVAGEGPGVRAVLQIESPGLFTTVGEPPRLPSPAAAGEGLGVRATLQIESPGLFTTVQDLGRPGLARFGVTRGGAIDRAALILGNRLVENDPGAAGLECTLSGPVVRFSHETVIAITGADLGATLDGAPVPMWIPLLAPAGSRLAFAPAPVGAGARAYVTVAGGIEVPPVLGSRATDLIGQFGGVDGHALAAGDTLPLAAATASVEALLRRRLAINPPAYTSSIEARVVLGPQDARFTGAGLASFLGHPYRVTSRSDRTGIRLEGPAIEQTRGADLISEGIAYGAIQVPGDGQPIVLLTARQTVGGYVKIATVIGADLDRLGQVRSGDEIHFAAVSVEEARAATIEARERLAETAVIEIESGTERMSDVLRSEASGAWTPDGVIRIIAEAERAGVTQLRLEVASAGITLDLTRGTPSPPNPLSPAGRGGDDVLPSPGAGEGPGVRADLLTITAPVLGTFYRRPAPEAPLFVTEGQAVAAGDAIGLIEVMKTYHEVTAPSAGTIEAVLAEDGHYVEYGQPLMTLRPD